VTVNFTCSWPGSDLSPNSRIHWAVRAKATKSLRNEAMLLAITHTSPEWRERVRQAGRLAVKLKFVPPSRRGFDADNRLASFKGGLDGISDAIGLNDRHFKVEFELSQEPIKGGGVMVTLEPA